MNVSERKNRKKATIAHLKILSLYRLDRDRGKRYSSWFTLANVTRDFSAVLFC